MPLDHSGRLAHTILSSVGGSQSSHRRARWSPARVGPWSLMGHDRPSNSDAVLATRPSLYSRSSGVGATFLARCSPQLPGRRHGSCRCRESHCLSPLAAPFPYRHGRALVLTAVWEQHQPHTQHQSSLLILSHTMSGSDVADDASSPNIERTQMISSPSSTASLLLTAWATTTNHSRS